MKSMKPWLAALALMAVLPACDSGTGPTPAATPTPPTPVATPVPPPPPPATPNLSGSWDSEARRWHFRLEHRGNAVTGQLLGFRDVYYSNPEHSDLAITGTVSSTGAVNFSCAAFGVAFVGRIESGSRMTGTLSDCGNGCRDYGEILVRTGN